MRSRSEENGGAEDALEGADQPAVLGPTLLHTEGVQHLGGAGERDPGALLPGGQSCQKERDETILAPRKSVVGMTGDEQYELAVATFMDQRSGWRALDREAAKHKWAGGEPQVLTGRLAPQADRLDEFPFPESPARSDRTYAHPVENLTRVFEAVLALPALWD